MVRHHNKLNRLQQIAAQVYGGGDYAHITSRKEAQSDHCGDTLFTFIMRELSDHDDPGLPFEEGVRRMETAIRELQEVLAALEAWHDPDTMAADGWVLMTPAQHEAWLLDDAKTALALVGSGLYETLERGAAFYIRRVEDDGDDNES